ncbi:hypothetical protein PSPO01_10495 [Paraphaeosphaeria sporulosa]
MRPYPTPQAKIRPGRRAYPASCDRNVMGKKQASVASPARHSDWLVLGVLARAQTAVPDMGVAPPESPPLWLWQRACPPWELFCAPCFARDP